MEGPSIRTFPRIEMHKPVELRVGDQAINIQDCIGNLSAGGLFVKGEALPVGTPVRIFVSGQAPFEADGVVRYQGFNGYRGVGIEFTGVNEKVRKGLDTLIAELTSDGALPC